MGTSSLGNKIKKYSPVTKVTGLLVFTIVGTDILGGPFLKTHLRTVEDAGPYKHTIQFMTYNKPLR